jgi:hypothetical protein
VADEKKADGAPSASEQKANDKAYHEAFPKSQATIARNEETFEHATANVDPSDAEVKKADAKLPVFDPRNELPPGEPMPDTPSGAALMEVGNLNGEDADDLDAANIHGEAYQAAKRKRRWG